ncbi:MAG TPA: hypothetical protein VOA88_21025 [Candidatus Dormibacteraeota bacterium]|nr:hypothetical protein [Candidatus Dormibacteraeota bacterium]
MSPKRPMVLMKRRKKHTGRRPAKSTSRRARPGSFVIEPRMPEVAPNPELEAEVAKRIAPKLPVRDAMGGRNLYYFNQVAGTYSMSFPVADPSVPRRTIEILKQAAALEAADRETWQLAFKFWPRIKDKEKAKSRLRVMISKHRKLYDSLVKAHKHSNAVVI